MKFFRRLVNKRIKIFILFLPALLTVFNVMAEGPEESSISNPFVVMMIIIIALLALIIGLLAHLVLGAAEIKRQEEKDEAKRISPSVQSAAILVGLLLLSFSGRAEEKAMASVNVINGISSTAFYMMLAVISLELIVVASLLYNLKVLLKVQKTKKLATEHGFVQKPGLNWWDKLNRFKPVDEEVAIDLGHDYDGIRELDNRLPPWWLYGFYCTIIFAGIYLWRYHVSHTAPLSLEELQISMKTAEVQKEAYLKKAANNVDENSVKILQGQNDLSAGKDIFQTTCAACHGKSGEGSVGPNLTDDYWLHGGSIHDIFKTIKYGWPEKGMKSWKDDYSPSQIAQLASYIKSIHGTNPPNGKQPQGNLFSEQADSVGTKDPSEINSKN